MKDNSAESGSKSACLTFDRLGCSCKLPASKLYRLLRDSGMEKLLHSRQPVRIDSASAIIQTVDFFTPVSEDPIYQGMISATNVFNDLYSMGVPKILGYSVILGLKSNISNDVAKQILKGVGVMCKRVGTQIVGGHTTETCDIIVGGCAFALADPEKLLRPKGAKIGDVLGITKPLGPQLVMMASYLENRNLLPEGTLTGEIVDRALEIMSHPANKVAEVLSSNRVNAATDITGFGLYEHARNMAEDSKVDFQFESLPVLKGTPELAGILGQELEKGKTPETAGGILISLPTDSCNIVQRQLQKNGESLFLVGKVTKKQGTRSKVSIPSNVSLVEV